MRSLLRSGRRFGHHQAGTLPFIVLFIWASTLSPRLWAAEDPVHEELRTLKRAAEEALNKRDLDRLLGLADRQVVATWQDARVSRGHEGVRSYYEEMLSGDDSVVRDVQTEIVVDELSHLYGGDTALSTGDMVQHFELRDGRQFDLNSRWTATLVLDNGAWRIAGFHVSASMFDNPILSIAMRRTMLWSSVIAGVLGIAIGLLLMTFLRRNKTA